MLETYIVYKYQEYCSYTYQTGNFVEPMWHSMHVGIVIQEIMYASAGAFDAQELTVMTVHRRLLLIDSIAYLQVLAME